MSGTGLNANPLVSSEVETRCATVELANDHPRPDDAIRVDVLLLAPRRWPRHIVNAWQP